MEDNQTDSLPTGSVKKNHTSNALMLAILIAFVITIILMLWIGSLFYGIKEMALNCSEKAPTIIGTNNVTKTLENQFVINISH